MLCYQSGELEHLLFLLKTLIQYKSQSLESDPATPASLLILKWAGHTAASGPLFWRSSCLYCSSPKYQCKQASHFLRSSLKWLLPNEAFHGLLPKKITILHTLFPTSCPSKFSPSHVSLSNIPDLYLSWLVPVLTTSTGTPWGQEGWSGHHRTQQQEELWPSVHVPFKWPNEWVL